MSNKITSNLRWIILIIMVIGWYFSLGVIETNIFYYNILTLISFICLFINFNFLSGSLKRNIHLWIILFIYFTGYYIKFYILCYMKLNNSELFYLNYPVEAHLFNNSNILIKYYEMITIVFIVFSFLVFFLTKNIDQQKILRFQKINIDHKIYISRFKIQQLLLITILLFIILFVIQINLKIGLVSGADRQIKSLPFRLAGIIMMFYNIYIPLLFLILIWLSYYSGSKKLINLSTICYFISGIIAGAISTSKASLINVFISFVALLFITDRLTKKHLKIFLFSIPFLIIFNILLQIMRVMRITNPNNDIYEILRKSLGVLSFNEINLYNILSLFLRVSGTDSLLSIINYVSKYSFSFDRSWYLLVESNYSIDAQYVLDVLSSSLQKGVAFAPSLLGFFTLVFVNTTLICLCMAIYTLIWHYLFKIFAKSKLLIKPIIFSLFTINVARYSSEGTLESMPLTIILIVIAGFVGEYIIRFFTTYDFRQALNDKFENVIG